MIPAIFSYLRYIWMDTFGTYSQVLLGVPINSMSRQIVGSDCRYSRNSLYVSIWFNFEGGTKTIQMNTLQKKNGKNMISCKCSLKSNEFRIGSDLRLDADPYGISGWGYYLMCCSMLQLCMTWYEMDAYSIIQHTMPQHVSAYGKILLQRSSAASSTSSTFIVTVTVTADYRYCNRQTSMVNWVNRFNNVSICLILQNHYFQHQNLNH